MLNTLRSIAARICHKIFFRRIIYSYTSEIRFNNKNKNALVYYKTDWYTKMLFGLIKKGTNDYEIMQICNILNRYGYRVDVADRSYKKPELEMYDLFIGVCAGGGVKHIGYYLDNLRQGCLKICYSTGASIGTTLRQAEKRLEYLQERKSSQVKLKLTRVSETDYTASLQNCNCLFYNGSDFCKSSYNYLDKKMYNIQVPSNETISFSFDEIENRARNCMNSFLYFAGPGMLHKGLDILLDVFSLPQNNDLHLHICTVPSDSDFVRFYTKELFESDNIHFHGYISDESKEFYNLTNKCAFVIILSCSEANPASIATCAKRGLVSLANYESDTLNCSIPINNIEIQSVSRVIRYSSELDYTTYTKKSVECLLESIDYSTLIFEHSFTKALIGALSDHFHRP